MKVFSPEGIIEIEPYEIFTTKCNHCEKEISTAAGKNNGLYENEDFHLWGPFALCKECDARLMKSYESYCENQPL
jgi:hypothetical protein